MFNVLSALPGFRHVHIHIHIHIHIHLHLTKQEHIHLQVHIQKHIQKHIHLHVHLHLHVHIHLQLHVHVHVHVHLHVCVCGECWCAVSVGVVCLYIFHLLSSFSSLVVSSSLLLFPFIFPSSLLSLLSLLSSFSRCWTLYHRKSL